MRWMGWTWPELQRCKMRHYRALVGLLNDEARQRGRKR